MTSPLAWGLNWAAEVTQRNLKRQERIASEAAAYRRRWLERRQAAAEDLAGLASAVLAAGASPSGAVLDRVTALTLRAAERSLVEMRDQLDLTLALGRLPEAGTKDQADTLRNHAA